MFPSISDGVCQALKELRESKNTADIKSVVSADLQQAVLSENCVPFFWLGCPLSAMLVVFLLLWCQRHVSAGTCWRWASSKFLWQWAEGNQKRCRRHAEGHIHVYIIQHCGCFWVRFGVLTLCFEPCFARGTKRSDGEDGSHRWRCKEHREEYQRVASGILLDSSTNPWWQSLAANFVDCCAGHHWSSPTIKLLWYWVEGCQEGFRKHAAGATIVFLTSFSTIVDMLSVCSGICDFAGLLNCVFVSVFLMLFIAVSAFWQVTLGVLFWYVLCVTYVFVWVCSFRIVVLSFGCGFCDFPIVCFKQPL